MPWNEILSKPVEVFLDELVIVCEGSSTFDVDFMRKLKHSAKKQAFEELLKQLDGGAGQKQETNQDASYLQQFKQIIKENMRF